MHCTLRLVRMRKKSLSVYDAESLFLLPPVELKSDAVMGR